MDKNEIRERALAIRNSLSDEECMEKSATIFKKLNRQDAFLSAWKVALYASFSKEVKVLSLRHFVF